jgi:predicted homoserine dehydrogenase-like protein
VILVDAALRRRAEEGRPVRLAIVGAGTMGTKVTRQVTTATPGMEVVAISNRHPERAEAAFRAVGHEDLAAVGSVEELERAIVQGRPAVTDDPALLCEAEGVDVVMEATGTIEFGARVVSAAIAHGKHVVTSNAELQGTLGPILKTRADAAGVVLTDADGDQPGVIMNLYRHALGVGMRPVLLGNVKGLQDPYRTPETQAAFAADAGISPQMATSFADGTKISCEMALVANATGFPVGRRGAYGPRWEGHVEEGVDLFPREQMLETGLTDYLLGAHPSPGVFVYATHDDPVQRHSLAYYKMGPGPIYTFYVPTHLCHFEVPNSVARAVLFGDATVAPAAGPVVEVVALAKRDLEAGDTLDGIGGFDTYGAIENAPVAHGGGLLPMGLAEGCRVLRDIPRDEAITEADVERPPGRLADALHAEQVERFSAPTPSTGPRPTPTGR